MVEYGATVKESLFYQIELSMADRYKPPIGLDGKQVTRHRQASPSPTRTSHRASARPNPNLQQEGLPLIQPLKRAEFFAVSNIRRRFVFGEPGMQRREISEIPREAVREAIANALPHRDYTTDTAVEVNVYMDFVERDEPGPLPRGRRSGKPHWQGQTATSSSATRTSRRCSSARV